MLKKIYALIFCCLMASSIFAADFADEAIPVFSAPTPTVEYARTYFSYSLGFPRVVEFQMGHAEQKGHHGFNVGIGVIPLIFFDELTAYADYLYYPKPNIASEYYIGLGLRSGVGYWNGYDPIFFIDPRIIVGKRWLRKNGSVMALQLELTPFYQSESMEGYRRKTTGLWINVGFTQRFNL